MRAAMRARMRVRMISFLAPRRVMFLVVTVGAWRMDWRIWADWVGRVASLRMMGGAEFFRVWMVVGLGVKRSDAVSVWCVVFVDGDMGVRPKVSMGM